VILAVLVVTVPFTVAKSPFRAVIAAVFSVTAPFTVVKSPFTEIIAAVLAAILVALVAIDVAWLLSVEA